MKELQEKVFNLLKASTDTKTYETIKTKKELPPFSSVNHAMAYLLSKNIISYADYISYSDDYMVRNSKNRYLYLFEMAPRTFGQTWGEEHIRKLFPDFERATKSNLKYAYPAFDGEFDLWYKGIRVEVKACRANSDKTKGSLSSRAYTHDEARKARFKYHYQQLKPSCCDVFIWIGACRDELLYWVLSSKELLNSGKLGPQHRNENTGNNTAEVFEGQVFMTEEELKPFLVEEANILDCVVSKFKSLT